MGLVLGGGGETGSQAVERNQKQMVLWWGPGAGKVPTVACGLGSAPWAEAIWGNGLGEAPGCGRTGPRGYSLSHPDPCLPAWAEVAPRSKRRCVLERKQPYSGDEWCSGPDSEEDDKPLGAAHSECPSLPGCCGPWRPRETVALREPPSLHLGLSRTQAGPKGARTQGPGLLPSSSPISDSVPPGTDSSIPTFQVLSSPLSLGTWVGWMEP